MKRILKTTVLLSLVLMMCMCFCSCDELDELKDTHGVFTSDNYETFELNGVTYKMLPFDYDNMDMFYISSFNKEIHVTQEGVPDLLSEQEGMYMTMSVDGKYVIGYIYADGEEGRDVIYCKEELYDDIYKQIENGVAFTKYSYEYIDYSDTDLKDGDNYDEKYGYTDLKSYYLTQEENDLINKITEKEPEEFSLNDEIGSSFSRVLTQLLSHDENGLFTKSTFLVYQYDDTYILEKEDSTPPAVGSSENVYYGYKVPKEYKDEFDKIFKYAIEEQEAYDKMAEEGIPLAAE